MVTHTHDGGDSVKKNRKQQAEEKKRRLFESLDRKGQAYFGFMEHSGLSMDAVALFQYLMSKQGSKSHAFPSMLELTARFQCHKRRIRKARNELLKAIPEVFVVVKVGGTSRDSYKLTPYQNWPIAVCERLWFGASVAPHNRANAAPQTQESGSTVAPLHGNSNGDSLNGNSKETIEHREKTQKPVDLWAAVAPLG